MARNYIKKDRSFRDCFFNGFELSKEEFKKRGQARIKVVTRSGVGEIGAIPSVVNQKRIDDCEFDFKLFCTTYFPLEFYLELLSDHLKVIDKIESAVLKIGRAHV